MHLLAPRIAKILVASAVIAAAAAASAPGQPAALKLGVQPGNTVNAEVKPIAALSVTWGAASSDPQEGGEVVRGGGGHSMLGASERRYRPGKPTYGNATFTSPPAAAEAKPKISEIPITKVKDVASSNLDAAPPGGASEPGKLEYPNLAVAGMGAPPPAGTATVTVARGICASGQHFPAVSLSIRGKAVQLNDVDVSGCEDRGDTSVCTLTYRSLGG